MTQRKILNVLAQFPEGRSKRQIAILARYSISGGTFNGALGTLKKAGYIEGTATLYTMTNSGKAVVGKVAPLPQGEALRRHWHTQLNTCEAAIIDTLAKKYPRAITRQEIAHLTGYEATGGSFNAALSKLRALELIRGQRELVLDATLSG